MARDLRVRVRLQADTKDAVQGVGAFRTGFSSMLATVGKFTLVGTAVAVAVGKIVGKFNEWIEAANKQEDAISGLNAQLSKFGSEASGISAALQEQASALQNVTRFGDEATIAAQAQLAVFANSEETIKGLTVATQDFATAQGVDLVTASKLIGKTLGSSTNALVRYGIEIEGAAGSTERANSIVNAISDLFGGRATEAAKTYSGALEQLANAQGDVAESFGQMISSSQTVIDAQRELAQETALFNSELDKSPGFMARVVTAWIDLKILLVDTARVFNGIQEQQFESVAAIRQRAKEEQSLANFARLDALERQEQEKEFQRVLDASIAKQKEMTALLKARDEALAAGGVRTRDEIEKNIAKTQEQIEIIETLRDIGDISQAQFIEATKELSTEQAALNAVLNGSVATVAEYKAALLTANDGVVDFGNSTVFAREGLESLGGGFDEAGARAGRFGETVGNLQSRLDGAVSSAARLTAATGGGGVRARDSRNQGAVDQALAAGNRITQGGTRIAVRGGGTRLIG